MIMKWNFYYTEFQKAQLTLSGMFCVNVAFTLMGQPSVQTCAALEVLQKRYFKTQHQMWGKNSQ